MNSENSFKFAESSVSFLQNSVFFCMLLRQAASSVQRVNNDFDKILSKYFTLISKRTEDTALLTNHDRKTTNKS